MRGLGGAAAKVIGRRAAVLVAFACLLAIVAIGQPRAGAAADGDAAWVDAALASQYELGSDVGLRDAPLVGSHNSFNSEAELGAGLPRHGGNQTLGLADQLDAGVRSLELDLHRDPRTGDRPVVCHTQPREGCGPVADLDPLLGEVAGWLASPAGSDQVLLLYLEDDLDDRSLHDQAAAIIERELGGLIYRPRGAGCREIGGGLTREQVRAAGGRVVIVSGCGKGSAWRSLAFSWRHHLEARPRAFEDFPACGPDYRRPQYRRHLVRYYEDSTREAGSGGADDGLGRPTVAAMERCGVDLLGFDRLRPGDGRLAATIWSWAAGEPAGGRCALIRTGGRLRFGRWVAVQCDSLRARPVCRGGRRWRIGPRPLAARRAAGWCRRRGLVWAVPRTGYENQLVRRAMRRRGTRAALLGYRLRGGAWSPFDVRGRG